ncbi:MULTISPECIES: C45 family autoproteolytic acyltransferase/hydolase [unclassified Pseudomonas]|uniref:C45 family autoproteolytic acyltransferase/hydolase n=1 Tax=unclassified Pseudomonas TaxID=196821 RepID=UPI00244AE18C|nr:MULTISPECIES: C45 family autoproteolytic acyltransferase/hydolase [unclassified Pseudomonas]MDH0300978.1 C45 family peptidase [Pseudomonas sp. GD04091]MDH1983490.1 C45 family peptidase [Pseudomonas sp. GD03689]
MKIHAFVTETSDPHARGQQVGERFAEQIRQTTGRYLDFFPRVDVTLAEARRIGENSLAALEAWSPDLANEIHGLASGAGLPLWQLASLNARTEVLAARSRHSECSTTVHAPRGVRAPQTLQTWDWHDSLCPHGLMLALRSRSGLAVKLFCEFGMLAKLGVNSAGLGLHFNILHHRSDNADGGVPVHAIARRLLDEARSVEEAIELARSARVSASTVLTVFSREDRSPRAVSIELSPERTALVLPREDGWLLHTNHFLDPQLAAGEQVADRADTQCRLAHLEQVIGQMTGADLRARAEAMCGAAGDAAPICFHPDLALPDTERWQTLLSVGIDTEHGFLDYVAGTPLQLAKAGSQRF